MNKNWVLAAALGLGAMGGVAADSFAQGRDTVQRTREERPQGLDDIIDATYKVRNIVDLHADIYPVDSTTLIGEGAGHATHYASCFGIAHTASGTYLLTAAHVTKDDSVQERPHPLGVARVHAIAQHISIIHYVNGDETPLCDLEEIARDADSDVSLLYARGVHLATYSQFVRPSDVKLGDIVYTIGFPHQEQGSFGKSLHKGVVSCIESDWPQIKWEFVDSTLDSGMSGGPALVQLDGRVYLLGVNSIQFDSRLLRNTYGVSKNALAFLQGRPNSLELIGKRFY